MINHKTTVAREMNPLEDVDNFDWLQINNLDTESNRFVPSICNVSYDDLQ